MDASKRKATTKKFPPGAPGSFNEWFASTEGQKAFARGKRDAMAAAYIHAYWHGRECGARGAHEGIMERLGIEREHGLTLHIPTSSNPTLGETVPYTITQADIEEIHNRLRIDPITIGHAALGTYVEIPLYEATVPKKGDQFPATVTKISAGGTINVVVQIDGNFTLWRRGINTEGSHGAP